MFSFFVRTYSVFKTRHQTVHRIPQPSLLAAAYVQLLLYFETVCTEAADISTHGLSFKGGHFLAAEIIFDVLRKMTVSAVEFFLILSCGQMPIYVFLYKYSSQVCRLDSCTRGHHWCLLAGLQTAALLCRSSAVEKTSTDSSRHQTQDSCRIHKRVSHKKITYCTAAVFLRCHVEKQAWGLSLQERIQQQQQHFLRLCSSCCCWHSLTSCSPSLLGLRLGWADNRGWVKNNSHDHSQCVLVTQTKRGKQHFHCGQLLLLTLSPPLCCCLIQKDTVFTFFQQQRMI